MGLHAHEHGQSFLKFLRDRSAQLQPHNSQMVALLEEFFHLTAKIFLVVLKFFIVEADVRIAGHGQHTGFLHRIGVEQRWQPAQEDVFRAHKARFARKQEKRRRAVRRRHDADRLMPLFAFQQGRGIQPFVDKVRNGMVRHDHDGRQDRQQLCFEKTVDLLQLARVQRFRRDILYAALGKRFHDGSIDLLLHGKKPRNDAVNMVQLLRRCPVGFVVGVIRRHVSKIEETTNAHHEKLVEIARENRNKFQPVQSRNAWVCRFFQHTPVKTQPTQFTVLGISVWFFKILWHRYPSRTPYLLTTNCSARNRWNTCCKMRSPGTSV